MSDLRLDRDAQGHFLPGNKASTGWNRDGFRNLIELRTAFLQASAPERVQDIEAELFRIATTDKDSRVRLAAIALYLDRTLGRVKETVEVKQESVSYNGGPVPTVSQEDLRQLDTIMRKYEAGS
jgi:hypothetical protein